MKSRLFPSWIKIKVEYSKPVLVVEASCPSLEGCVFIIEVILIRCPRYMSKLNLIASICNPGRGSVTVFMEGSVTVCPWLMPYHIPHAVGCRCW
jgi:hypothetical protein